MHEYGIPVVYASDKPSNAFCYKPTEIYEKTREEKGTSVYHRLGHENHKILLGANLKGYIYVLKGSDFFEIVREDFELGKWIRSTEWLSPHEVTSIEVTKPYDWEMPPEYEFLGTEHVGEMSAKEYIAFIPLHRTPSHPPRRPAQLQTVSSRRPIDIEQIADNVQIGDES